MNCKAYLVYYNPKRFKPNLKRLSSTQYRIGLSI
ncbi:IS3 family transposase [Aggregatibacter actinomycetemcomitans]